MRIIQQSKLWVPYDTANPIPYVYTPRCEVANRYGTDRLVLTSALKREHDFYQVFLRSWKYNKWIGYALGTATDISPPVSEHMFGVDIVRLARAAYQEWLDDTR